jgi:site-specific DNA recombinase
LQLHPNAAELYAAKVSSLEEALNWREISAEATEALRGMIEKIVLRPHPHAPDGLACELHGAFAKVLALVHTEGRARNGGRRSLYDLRGENDKSSVVVGTRNRRSHHWTVSI